MVWCGKKYKRIIFVYPSMIWLPLRMSAPQGYITTYIHPPFISFICICPSSSQRSSVALCDPMDCSMPGLPVLHQLPELAQTYVHQVNDAIQPSYPLSSPVVPFSSRLQSFPASGSFPMNQLFTAGGQSMGLQLYHQSF